MDQKLCKSLTEHIEKSKQMAPSRSHSRSQSGLEPYQQEDQQFLNVDPPPQTKPSDIIINSYGIECDSNVQNTTQLIYQLLETGTFVPEFGMSQDQKMEHKSLFTNLDGLDNNRNIGSIVGVTAFGFIGFVGLGFNVFGAAGGGAAGFFLGRYAGQKVTKKIYKKHGNLKEYDLFILRLRCVLRWIETQEVKYRYNINVYRFAIERLMIELKPMLHYRNFDKWMQNEAKAILKQFRTALNQEKSILAIYLAYKLSKEYVKILDTGKIYSRLGKADFEYVLAYTVQNVLIPFESLFASQKPKKNKVALKLSSKILKLYMNSTVQYVLSLHPDPQLTISFIKIFSNKMKEIAKFEDIQNFLQTQTYKDEEALGVPNVAASSAQIEENKSQKSPQKKMLLFVKQKSDQKDQKSQKMFQSYQDIPAVDFEDPIPGPLTCEVNNKSEVFFKPRSHSRSQSLMIKKPIIGQILQMHGDDIDIEKDSIHSVSKHEKPQSLEQIQVQPSQQIILHQKPITNQTNSKLSDELENKFTLMIDIINEPVETWDIVLKKENILIYKTFKPGNEAVFVKGYGDIPGVNKDTVLQVSMSLPQKQALYNPELRTKWDKLLENFHVVEKESDVVDIVYYYVASPFGAANRDFLQKRICRERYPKEDQDCLLYFSVDHKKAPNPKGYVRCQTFLSGYIIENLSDYSGARLYFVTNNNVGGNVPKSIINFVATRAPVSWFNSLRKGCKDLATIQQKQEQKQKLTVSKTVS